MTAVSRPPDAPEDHYGPAGRSAWLDVDWAAHRRRIELDGTSVNVVEIGSGPPLLLVHGLSGCWQNWLENIPHFARTHRVIAPDLPGFGASEMPEGEISIGGYARFADRLCAALGVDAAAVVGNSMGGFVGTELAIRFPQRVERLVLVSAAGISIEHVQREPVLAVARAMALSAGWSASRLDAFARRPGLRRLALGLVCHRPDLLPAPLALELMKGSGRAAFLPALEAHFGYPIRERLPEIACPTLIVWGEKDRIIPVRDAATFERLIPNARKLVYPRTGHVAMLERPARFNADLEAFLAEEPAPQPAAGAARDDAAEAA
jgi:pimeloyl-ACP methyl ester carboxylesterase